MGAVHVAVDYEWPARKRMIQQTPRDGRYNNNQFISTVSSILTFSFNFEDGRIFED